MFQIWQCFNANFNAMFLLIFQFGNISISVFDSAALYSNFKIHLSHLIKVFRYIASILFEQLSLLQRFVILQGYHHLTSSVLFSVPPAI